MDSFKVTLRLMLSITFEIKVFPSNSKTSPVKPSTGPNP